jgi:nicotinamidase-related amidase
MKTLIIVDAQKDFYSPEGSLYVNYGEKIIPEIAKLIKEDKTINQVIFTVDWHTHEDQSFNISKGSWPVHCVQYTEGATIAKELLEAVWERGFKSIDGKFNGEELSLEFLKNTYDVFVKGDTPDQEEYGAFENSSNEREGIIGLSNISEDSMSYLNPDNDLIVCGLAGDFCVLETAKNLYDIPELKGELMMFLPGIASLDGGVKLEEWMKRLEVKAYGK